jgi:uncharacterized protein YegP (UPF0339 family)
MPGKHNALVRTYNERFGEPLTTDEVYGYWLFVAGVALAAVGVLGFLATDQVGATREAAFALGAVGLTGLLTGVVIGQSFDRRAKLLVYLGAAVCLAAVAWFTTVYPSDWVLGNAATTNVILLYTAGLALVALSGAIAPVAVGQSRAREAVEAELARTQSERAAAREEAERASEEAAAAGEAGDAAREEAAAAEAHLERLHDSNATFQMYRDNAGQWRWRLVHQNSNIIATGGESYASNRNVRRGVRSVKRNGLGADVIWEREEDPDPEADLIAADPQATFEVYEDEAGDHRWRLRHDNGEIIAAAARGFSAASGARDGVDGVREYVAAADYLEFDPAAFEVYEDRAGEYRWRLVHRNGRILADSGEGYASRSNARRAVDTVVETAAAAAVGAEDGPAFEVYEDGAGDHRWRLVSANGELVADGGEGYSGRSAAVDAAERVEEYAPEADTLTVGEAAVEVFEDEAGEYRWRLRHRNGTTMATGGEGYSDRSGAVAGVNSVKRNAPNAPEASE